MISPFLARHSNDPPKTAMEEAWGSKSESRGEDPEDPGCPCRYLAEEASLPTIEIRLGQWCTMVNHHFRSSWCSFINQKVGMVTSELQIPKISWHIFFHCEAATGAIPQKKVWLVALPHYPHICCLHPRGNHFPVESLFSFLFYCSDCYQHRVYHIIPFVNSWAVSKLRGRLQHAWWGFRAAGARLCRCVEPGWGYELEMGQRHTNDKLGISWGYNGIRNEQYKLECVCTNRVIKPLKWETHGESEDKAW